MRSKDVNSCVTYYITLPSPKISSGYATASMHVFDTQEDIGIPKCWAEGRGRRLKGEHIFLLYQPFVTYSFTPLSLFLTGWLLMV